jgi:hypothetical protein
VSALLQPVDPESLRAALRAVFAGREYRWAQPSSGWIWMTELWHRALDWLFQLHIAHPLRYYVVVAALTLALVVVLVHLGYLVWRSVRAADGAGAAGPAAVPPRGAAWHLAEARRLSGAGRFAEALAHRFLALALDLDERRVLQFHPSKTPAEYAAEARLDAGSQSQLAQLVTTLYRHVFGGAACDAACWRDFDAQAAALGLHVATR